LGLLLHILEEGVLERRPAVDAVERVVREQ
jgi:hypothetical protein